MRNMPNNYQNLSLTYEDYQVKDNLLYIKFCIFNTQSYDCSCPKDTQPIIIEVPEGVKWIDSKVSKQSPDVESGSNMINDRELGIHFNLLRDKEYLSIDGLLESSLDLDQDELQDKIRIKHRIPNFGAVKKVTGLSSYGIKKSKRRIWSILVYLMIIFLTVGMVWVFNEKASPLKFVENSSGMARSFYLNKDNQLVYLERDFPWNRYSDPIPRDSFERDYSISWTQTQYADNSFLFMLGSIGLLFIMGSLIVAVEVYSIRKSKKIEKITS